MSTNYGLRCRTHGPSTDLECDDQLGARNSPGHVTLRALLTVRQQLAGCDSRVVSTELTDWFAEHYDCPDLVVIDEYGDECETLA